MATRYWVGGSGTWSSSSTTNWSATSGGAALVASGASVIQVATHGASGLMSQTTPAALTSGSKVSICIEYVVA